jgi:uracil phosphoribosyltransferase
MSRVTEVKHPLVAHHLTRLRDERTAPAEFRALVRRLTALLAYEAAKDLPTRPQAVRTPLTETTGTALAGRIGLVPILRAGIGMVEPVLDLIPEAEVWHLGIYRDEDTRRPVEYYKKLPADRPVDVALMLDPMLATGGSAVAALEAIAGWGVPTVKLLALIAAPEGVRRVAERFPEVSGFVCAVDERLDDRCFIVPGLGDAGDRMFNARA